MNKTYKKSKINYEFPEAGSRAWINAIKKACKHPGFKLKASNQTVEQALKSTEDLSLAKQRDLMLARVIVKELAND